MSLITEAQIRGLLLVAEGDLSPDELARWEPFRIDPESWALPEGSDFGFGFWAVACHRNHVVWYNHLAEGFQLGSFTATGKIDAATCVPSLLGEVLASWKTS
jgi:hypothetical protein